MIRSNTAQLRLPLDEWDIFNSYAENREDELSPMSTHWTMTAASAAGGFPIALDQGPQSADSNGEDPYYKQASYVKPTLQARFAETSEDAPTLILKLRKRRKQNMSVDAGRDARTEDDGIRAILSAAHSQAAKSASKSKKAFGKMISQLTNRDEMEIKEKENKNSKFLLKSAGPVEGDVRSAKDHFFVTCGTMPARPAAMKRIKSDFDTETQKRLQISSPILVIPPPPTSRPPSPPAQFSRANTFVRKHKALPLLPSPIPAL